MPVQAQTTTTLVKNTGEPGAFYIADRGYVDFERLFLLHSVGAFFIIRAKSNTRYARRYSHPVDKTTGLRCDQTVTLTGAKGRKHYPQPLRRIKWSCPGLVDTFRLCRGGALALVDAHTHAGGVDIGELQSTEFARPQPRGVGGHQHRAVSSGLPNNQLPAQGRNSTV